MTETASTLRVQLHAENSETRLAAVAQLATLDVHAMDLFAICLGDEDWRVRKAATETFFKYPYTQADIETLVGFLHHQDNAGLRNAAIEILVGLGSQAMEALCAKICDADVDVRKFVIDILGEIGDERCGDKVLQALEDSDSNVRYAAVETLGKLKIARAAEPLLDLIDDPDPGLKFALLQTLARLEQPVDIARLLPLLEDRLLRKAVYECLGFVGDSRAFAPLVQGLSDPQRNVRETALLALHRLTQSQPEAFTHYLPSINWTAGQEFLLEALRSERLEMKQAALGLFAFIGHCLPVDELLSCVRDEESRARALEVFARLGAQAYAGIMQDVSLLESWQVEILYIGGELGYAAAVPLALEALGAIDPQLRYVAVRVLAQAGDSSHISALIGLLSDEVVPIRSAAVTALASLAHRCQNAILPALDVLFHDPEAEKRVQCLRIMRELDGPQVQALLLKACQDPAAGVRAEAVRSLIGQVDDRVVAGLTLSLTDESAEVRRLAVNALAECSAPQALASLKLVSQDEDIWVRSAVMRALANFPAHEGVRDILARAISDEAGLVAIAALEGLTKIDSGTAQSFLTEAIRHRDEEVVKSALVLLPQNVEEGWLESDGARLLKHVSRDLRVLVADTLGRSSAPLALTLLENRLEIETDPLVIQALELALFMRRRRLAGADS